MLQALTIYIIILSQNSHLMYKDTCAHNILFMVGIQNLNEVDA